MTTVVSQIATGLSEDVKLRPPSNDAMPTAPSSESLVCVIEEFIKQKAREVLNCDQSWDGKANTMSEMNEGLDVNLGGGWDLETPKELHFGFDENKLMSSTPSTPDNNSVSTMLESLRSNLSQMYSGDITDSFNMSIKTESSVRSPDFSENTFNQQRELQQHGERSQPFENIYSSSSIPSSAQSLQQQFPCNPYNTSNTTFLSPQQSYPNYPVKPEPSSPSNYQPYYQTNNQDSYMSNCTNQSNYQGYRLSDMMVPSFSGSQNQIKQEKYPTLTHNSVLSHQLSNGVTEQKVGSDVTGPMRVRRIKRPIPAGPSYPVHLWQFILELLGDHSCKDFITWTGNDLEFKVLNSGVLAKRWGRRKNNSRMNFDKLSRAMRYYYEKNIIKHIPGQRLVYRFCRKPDDIVFSELLKTAMATLPPGTHLVGPVTINQHLAPSYNLCDGRLNIDSTLINSQPFPVSQCNETCLLQQTHLQTTLQHSSKSPQQLQSTMSRQSPANKLGHNRSQNTPSLTTPSLPIEGSFSSSEVGCIDNGNISEYMFTANCQVQFHLQSGDGLKKHHMMAS